MAVAPANQFDCLSYLQMANLSDNMTSSRKTQLPGTGSPLSMLIASTNLSVEEFAALITVRSGQKISAATIRRRMAEAGGLKNLSLTLCQWDVFYDLTNSTPERVRQLILEEGSLN